MQKLNNWWMVLEGNRRALIKEIYFRQTNTHGILLQSEREFDVGEGNKYLFLLLDNGFAPESRRRLSPEVVRDEGVETRGQLAYGPMILLSQKYTLWGCRTAACWRGGPLVSRRMIKQLQIFDVLKREWKDKFWSCVQWTFGSILQKQFFTSL